MKRIIKKSARRVLVSMALFGLVAAGSANASPMDAISDDGSVIAASAAEGLAAGGDSKPSRGTTGIKAMDAAKGMEYVPGYQEILSMPAATAKVGIESVIGADTRNRVYSTNYPARATALITFNQGSSSYTCTGWFFGPDVVATAGHCVNSGGNGSTPGVWSTNVKVYPGYSYTSAPYGYAVPRAGGLTTFSSWYISSNELADFGIIKLSTKLGNTVGWYGFFYLSTSAASFIGFPTQIIGYPGDKTGTNAKTPWEVADKVWTATASQVFYRNDTYGGMSGSGIWYDRPSGSSVCSNGPCAFGVHAYGLHGTSPHSYYNHGVGITQNIYNLMLSKKNQL